MNSFKTKITHGHFIFLSFIFCFNLTAGNSVINFDQFPSHNDSLLKAKEFKMITIPDKIKKPKDRAAYLALQYWNNFDFTDTVYIYLPQITEQAMADFIDVLPHTDEEIAHSSIISTLKKAEVNNRILFHFLSLFQKYLYDRNSPVRNDEYYIPVLDYIMSSERTNENEKAAAGFKMNMLMKNRIGNKASNFNYISASGTKNELYDIKSNYTIIIFYNPDCHSCKTTINYLKESDFFNYNLRNNQLNILAFSPEGDPQILKEHKGEIPDNWINGYDKDMTVIINNLYDLRAYPEIYLLDKNKNVILKNVKIDKVEEYLKKELDK